jgi:hypothetical protein
MATRSTIAKLGKDGIIKAVYCHSDGYLEHNGKVLNEYYRDESKVDELLAQGDISTLDQNIGEKLPFNDYMLFHEKKQCRFYHRDRGEDLMFNEFESDIEYLEWANEIANGFIYLYAYGAWYVYDNTFVKCYGIASYRFVELEEALQNEVV